MLQEEKDRTARTAGTTGQIQRLTPFHRDGTWCGRPGTTAMFLHVVQIIAPAAPSYFASGTKAMEQG
jgi:hypothetical protein